MSDALAIAGVTAVLKDLLDNGMIDGSISEKLGNVKVTSLAPELITLTTSDPARVNLFMYHITFNQGWRNEDLPSLGSDGVRINNPFLALDLHYLLTAYGQDEYHAEILLGQAMQLLHENPVLTREEIRASLSGRPMAGDPTKMAYPFPGSDTTDLASQIESLKITPEQLSIEEISKIWSAIQKSYRPTIGYKVSVVLIRKQRPARHPLPVRARGIYPYTFGSPAIGQLTSLDNEGDPVSPGRPIVCGQWLAILGKGLRGDITTVSVGGREVPPAAKALSDTCLVIRLPAELRAGTCTAQVIHKKRMADKNVTPDREFVTAESNGVPFVLRPSIDPGIIVTDAVIGPESYVTCRLKVGFKHQVDKAQRVLLLLNEYRDPLHPSAAPGRAYSFPAPANNGVTDDSVSSTDTITFDVKAVKGDYLARIRVDGAESLLGGDDRGRYNAPKVSL